MNQPATPRTRLEQISPRSYEHPADRAGLHGLRALSGFDAVLKMAAGAFRERSLRLAYMASGVRVSAEQLPEVHALVVEAARILDLDEVPDVFVVEDPRANALTIGLDHPWIVLTSGAVELYTSEELEFVIGHEMGHILSGHAVYRTMLQQLLGLAARASWVPVAGLGLQAVVFALEEWARSSELSCDRAGLLVSQSPEIALRVHMKMAAGTSAGDLNPEAFLAQAREYATGGDARDSVAKLLHLTGQSHPFATMRAAALREWAENGEYEEIIAGEYLRRSDEPPSARDEVTATLRSYQEKVSSSQDPLLRGIRDTASQVGEGGRAGARWLAGKVRDVVRPDEPGDAAPSSDEDDTPKR